MPAADGASPALLERLGPYLLEALDGLTLDLQDEVRALERGAELEARARWLGYWLAVIASSDRHDFVLARREPRALQWLGDLVARAGGAVASEVPLLARSSADGWSMPQAVACLLLGAREARWLRWTSSGAADGAQGLDKSCGAATDMELELRGHAERLKRAVLEAQAIFPTLRCTQRSTPEAGGVRWSCVFPGCLVSLEPDVPRGQRRRGVRFVIGPLKRLFVWMRPAQSKPAAGDPARVAEVEAVLEELRPMLRADGGDVTLVRVDEGRVELTFQGACASCSAHVLTFQGAMRPRLMERLGWVREVRAL